MQFLIFLRDQNSTIQYMHFGIFDKPAPVKYPKMHILIFQNLKIKIRILGYLTCYVSKLTQNSYFDLWVLVSQKNKTAYFDLSFCMHLGCLGLRNFNVCFKVLCIFYTFFFGSRQQIIVFKWETANNIWWSYWKPYIFAQPKTW